MITPVLALVVIKYWIWMYVFASAAYGLVTENDWLEKFCNVEEYQCGSPP